MEAIFREALACQNAGRLDEAERLYRSLGDWRPALVRGNLGMVLRGLGRLAEAEVALRQALAPDPSNVAVRHALGMTLLQLGRFNEGWPYYEARHQLYPRPAAPFAEWRGEPLSGRRIVVIGEQGFGDQILFARFLPRLAAEGAEVSLFVSPGLRRLLGTLPVRIETAHSWEDVRADTWVSIGSIPGRLNLAPKDAPTPYLVAPPTSGRGGVGLMLNGGDRNPNPRRIPDAAVAHAIRGLGAFVDLDPQVSGARDFADTAQIIAGLDVVVSVDTSVAHLAGALDKPCYVLAPRPASDWYTDWAGDGSPWYRSLRLIRQRTPGDWSGVVRELAAVLERRRTDSEISRP